MNVKTKEYFEQISDLIADELMIDAKVLRPDMRFGMQALLVGYGSVALPNLNRIIDLYRSDPDSLELFFPEAVLKRIFTLGDLAEYLALRSHLRSQAILLMNGVYELLEGEVLGVYTFEALIELGYPQEVIQDFRSRLESKTERVLFAVPVGGTWITTEERLVEAMSKT
jgi:hypothetical protein